PQPAPALTAILALPDAAACRTGPDGVRLLRHAADRRHAPADVCGTDQCPLRRSGLRRHRRSGARPLPDQRMGGRLPIRPGGAGLKPRGPLLVGRGARRWRATRPLLLRRTGKINIDAGPLRRHMRLPGHLALDLSWDPSWDLSWGLSLSVSLSVSFLGRFHHERRLPSLAARVRPPAAISPLSSANKVSGSRTPAATINFAGGRSASFSRHNRRRASMLKR